MSGREFTVPCVVCRCKPSNFRHSEGPPPPLTHAEAKIYHPYRPNEHSVEWAALKMREALDELREWPLRIESQQRADAALRLADAAGIKAMTTPTTTTP